MTTSKLAVSESPSDLPVNSGFTPIMACGGVMGRVMLRSTARPPGSAMRTTTVASSGRVDAGTLVERRGEARLAVGVGLGQIGEGDDVRARAFVAILVEAEHDSRRSPAARSAGAIRISPSRPRPAAGAP